MLCFNLEATFDTLEQDALLHKMVLLGIPAKLIQIIKSFLKNRKFFVRALKAASETRAIAGVSEGSFLSALLFLLYVIGMPKTGQTELALFADDTVILGSA